MANSYFFLNLGADLVMDVQGAKTTNGTPLDGWTQKTPASPNQFWTFEPGPAANPGFYFIKSNLGHNLVIDVQGGKTASGTPLDVWPQNSPVTANQLWKFAPTAPVPAQGYIQSQLGHNLVIDLKGEKTAKGTLLDVWPQASSKATQLWFLLPASGNTYNPKITSIAVAGQGFAITGTGFQAGTQVMATYQFTDPSTGGFSLGSFSAWTDFGGIFTNTSRIDELVSGSPGTLVIQIFFSIPAFPHGGVITAQWNGSQFTL